MSNGQRADAYLDRDYLLRTSKDGMMGYDKLLSRGELVTGKTKSFEIRSKVWFDRIVIDCWSRIPIYTIDEDIMPMNDKENVEVSKVREKGSSKFNYYLLHREIVEVDQNPELLVNISHDGRLSFIVKGDKITNKIDSSIHIH